MQRQRDRQASETQRSLTSDRLSKTVSQSRRADWSGGEGSLHTRDGQRKFLNDAERKRALASTDRLSKDRSLFVQLLAWTGARVSEVLSLSARSFQIEDGSVTIVTLKRRKLSVREVPLPDALINEIERHFGICRAQTDEISGTRRLWAFCRMTAWRIVKAVMEVAGIAGPQACPKGFRHGFGHAYCRIRTPLHIIQKWMGHARLSTTAIYMAMSGSEERAFAKRLWDDGDASPMSHLGMAFAA